LQEVILGLRVGFDARLRVVSASMHLPLVSDLAAVRVAYLDHGLPILDLEDHRPHPHGRRDGLARGVVDRLNLLAQVGLVGCQVLWELNAHRCPPAWLPDS
jgi:hypothetical protein